MNAYGVIINVKEAIRYSWGYRCYYMGEIAKIIRDRRWGNGCYECRHDLRGDFPGPFKCAVSAYSEPMCVCEKFVPSDNLLDHLGLPPISEVIGY